ncbi:MAG: carotenoid 1,2-hydratase [Burkholderiaceae bacterium]|nr:carotenoid 1,2-hydratase [Burkholderiaceae bacterium]
MLLRVISRDTPFLDAPITRSAAGRRRVLQGLAALPTLWFGSASPTLAGPATTGVQPRPLVFPADHGSHPDTRLEWWYVTGAVQPETGTEPAGGRPDPAGIFGFQVTFFRSRTEISADHPSRFAARQLVFAHAALTDLKRGRLLHDQRIARAGFGIAEAAVGDTALTLRDWRLARVEHDGASRYRAQVSSDTAGFGFDFQLDTTQALLLQGDAGYSRKGPRPLQASHYYSQPQLAVSGTLTRDGKHQPVRGSAWLDHEWSNSLLDPAAVGWDWIGMNLDDGSALTAFRLRGADGSTVYAGGSFRPAGGAVRNFATAEVRLTPGRLWTSPGSRARYPVEWTLDTASGRFRVKALLDAQELDSRASTGSIYWEGLSELQDEQGRRIGRGYLEMTGYAGKLSL